MIFHGLGQSLALLSGPMTSFPLRQQQAMQKKLTSVALDIFSNLQKCDHVVFPDGAPEPVPAFLKRQSSIDICFSKNMGGVDEDGFVLEREEGEGEGESEEVTEVVDVVDLVYLFQLTLIRVFH